MKRGQVLRVHYMNEGPMIHPILNHAESDHGMFGMVTAVVVQ